MIRAKTSLYNVQGSQIVCTILRENNIFSVSMKCGDTILSSAFSTLEAVDVWTVEQLRNFYKPGDNNEY